MNQQPASGAVNSVQRVRVWYALLLLVFGLFALRVFYLQVIRYDYYKKAAASDQLKQYEVPASRGVISAQLGDGTVPIVLNQKLYTLYADPTIVKNPGTVAAKLQPIIGGKVDDIEKLLKTKDTRYVVLGKKLTPAQNTKILAFKFPGVGTQEQDYRTYPQGSLASQLLGFVNNDGQGEYGVEQALNKQLAGKPGQLKAVTDINGVPLAASSNNLSTAPVAGDDVDLTINVGMQRQVEQILAQSSSQFHAQGIGAVVLDANTGAVKAMANYPTYNPADYQNVSNPALFQNLTVSEPIEMGSIMKTLTTATALNEGVIQEDSSFYDPGSWTIDDSVISDVSIDHSKGQQNIGTVLDLSLNTGATWMLMQLGGGQLNAKGRDTLHDYLVNHYMLGKATGIEQGYEASGYVPSPKDNGAGINLTWANVSFGQAVTATALQMASAISSALTGTYYQPYLVDSITSGSTVHHTSPKVVKRNVVSSATSHDLQTLMEYVVTEHVKEGYPYMRFSPNYIVGGKTGSAEVAMPSGGYSPTEINGTYAGFVGGDKPQYVIVVYEILPHITPGYFAGAHVAQPVFADIAHMLIDDFGVTPKSH
jgi:cell division protein FtsI/penicillin-binding protein 2